jgi:endonuclease-8
MPEGHSIRIHADKQQKLFADESVKVTSPQKRFDGAAKVTGQKLRDVEGVGKHLFYHFGSKRDESLVHVHLGRLGRFRYHDGAPPRPSPNCRMRLQGPAHTIDLSGPTDCSIVSAEKRQSILDRLGPDPLRKDADPLKAWERIHRSKKAVGALLLDQSIIAGLGNIFRAEILFLLRLHPAIQGNDLTRRQFDNIWKQSVRLLADGVKYGWIVTTTAKDIGKPIAKFKQADRFYVYKRKTCRLCGSEIKTLNVGSRTIFFCPKHQKPRGSGR